MLCIKFMLMLITGHPSFAGMNSAYHYTEAPHLHDQASSHLASAAGASKRSYQIVNCCHRLRAQMEQGMQFSKQRENLSHHTLLNTFPAELPVIAADGVGRL